MLVSAVGLVHLVETPEHFEAVPYLGALFAANFIVTLVAASAGPSTRGEGAPA